MQKLSSATVVQPINNPHDDSLQSPPGLVEDELQRESDGVLMLGPRWRANWEPYRPTREAINTAGAI